MKQNLVKLVQNEIKSIKEDFEYQAEKPLRHDVVDSEEIKEIRTKVNDIKFIIHFKVGPRYSYYAFMAENSDDLAKVQDERIIKDIKRFLEKKTNIEVAYDPKADAAGLVFRIMNTDLEVHMEEMLK